MDLLLLGVCLAVVQFLLSIWIKSRLESSIEHEYNKKLEEFRFEISKREKAANIAKSFAKWTKYNGKETDLLNKNELFDYYEELNKMSFELTLWIDDESLLEEIMKRFQNMQDALPIREILIKVKNYISNSKNIDFQANNIIIWPSAETVTKINLYSKD